MCSCAPEIWTYSSFCEFGEKVIQLLKYLSPSVMNECTRTSAAKNEREEKTETEKQWCEKSSKQPPHNMDNETRQVSVAFQNPFYRLQTVNLYLSVSKSMTDTLANIRCGLKIRKNDCVWENKCKGRWIITNKL